MYTRQQQQSYSIFYLDIDIVHAKKTSSCFMKKIKRLKCFLLTFLKESVLTQWILWSRYEMSRMSDANSPLHDFTER